MRPDGSRELSDLWGLASESRSTHSRFACLQTDLDFTDLISSELNAGLLYLEDLGEVSFHGSFQNAAIQDADEFPQL